MRKRLKEKPAKVYKFAIGQQVVDSQGRLGRVKMHITGYGDYMCSFPTQLAGSTMDWDDKYYESELTAVDQAFVSRTMAAKA